MLVHMPLEPIAPGVWAAPMAHVYMGLHIGTRMTVVRLSDGSLLLYSPIRLDDALKAEVDALGPVSHIVAPSRFHHVYFGEVASAYPDAKKHGAEGLEKKRKDLSFDSVLGESDADWANDLQSRKVDGCAIGETVLFHPASRTLITSDFLQNFDSSDHWATRQYLKLAGIHRRTNVSVPVRITYRDRRASRRAVDEIIEWAPEQITLAHGRPIQSDGEQAIRVAYQWL